MISEADYSRLLQSPSCALILSADGAIREQAPAPVAVLPGSFNPVHEGHWQLAAAAERKLRRPVIFEISVRNVDKPALRLNDIQTRVEQFRGRAALALTCAPRFVDKAGLFPGVAFVIGADTMVRLVEPRYYEGDSGKMQDALRAIEQAGCRFMVAGRRAESGWISTANIDVPPAFEHLFTEIPAHEFRCDISSSELRKSC